MSIPKEITDALFAELMPMVERREQLCMSSVTCPECGTAQIQLVGRDVPAQWKCRHCHHEFEYEPTDGI